jgi:two-component system OmpR family sensor kinase
VSIRTRIGLVVLVVSSVLIFGGVWLFDQRLEAGMEDTIDETLDARATPLVATLRDSRDAIDDDALARSVASHPRSLAQVIDADERVVASSLGRPAVAEAALPVSRLGPLDHRRYFEVEVDTPELEETRVLVVPVDRADGTWAVVVGSSLEITEHAHGVRNGLLIAGAIAVTLAAAGSWLLAHAALTPVERMRRAAAAITAGDEDGEITAPGQHNELAELAATFNDLLGRMRAALARERRLVADASHELRTPLAVLRTELELAARPGRSAEELRHAVDNAHGEATRLGRLADDMLLLARSDNGVALVRLEQHDLAEVLDRSLDAFRVRAANIDVSLGGDYPRPLRATCDPSRLRQAIDNLLDNALTHTPAGGRIVLAAVHDPGQIRISVVDEGPGFPVDFLPAAFVPFQRADPSRRRDGGGAGLGLAIVRMIAVAHGGDATAANRPGGRGATVSLTIPE